MVHSSSWMNNSEALSQHQTFAEEIVTCLERVVELAMPFLGGSQGLCPDESTYDQGLLLDLAAASSSIAAGRELLNRARNPDIALAYMSDLAGKTIGMLAGRGIPVQGTANLEEAIAAGRNRSLIEKIAEGALETADSDLRGYSDEVQLVRQTFKEFAASQVEPRAHSIHREHLDVPEDMIQGLARLDTFGLSVPVEYGGVLDSSAEALYSMLVATEELAKASLGTAGSLSTRPEIVASVISRGGTEEQKLRWLPEIASGRRMTAVAITEPEAGSDVSAVQVSARRDGDFFVLHGAKSWCTFGGRAEYLLVLARTDANPRLGHRGLSLFVVEKPPAAGSHFVVHQDDGGRIEGRAIATIGYRGMHSFDIIFDSWRVPVNCLVGEDRGLGRGFYLQLDAFTGARVQTAARAIGVMQGALEQCVAYARSRVMFGQTLGDLPLTRERVARMVVTIAASRALTLLAADHISARHPGAGLSAAQCKFFATASAEDVTHDAMQLHGGLGYAEESPISRLFLDARVLSIFEGANEVLGLRIIGRELCKRYGV